MTRSSPIRASKVFELERSRIWNRRFLVLICRRGRRPLHSLRASIRPAFIVAGLLGLLAVGPSANGQGRSGGGARHSGGFHHGGAGPRAGAAFRAASFGGGYRPGGYDSHKFYSTGGYHHAHRVGHVGRSIQHRHVGSIVCGRGFGLGVHYPYTFFNYPYCGPYYGDFYWKYPRYSIGYSYYESEAPFVYRYDDYWPANDALEGLIQETLPDGAVDEAEKADDDIPAELLPPLPDADQDASPPGPRESALSNEAAIAMGRGDKSFEQGNYDEAREEYVRAIVLAGEDAPTRIALGLAEYALGSFSDAARAIRRGVAISPELAESTFSLDAVYGIVDDRAAHRRALEDFARENPEDCDALFLVGFTRYFAGEREAGVETLVSYLKRTECDRSITEFVIRARRRTTRELLAAPEVYSEPFTRPSSGD